MRKSIFAIAAMAVLAASPASAAVKAFSEDFEAGFGAFSPQGNVVITPGSAYTAIGFQGNAAAQANKFASFGSGNTFIGGSLLSRIIQNTGTNQFNIDFDAGVIGSNPSEYLIFQAKDAVGNVIGATLIPPMLSSSTNLNNVFTRYKYSFNATGPVSLTFSSAGGNGDNADVLLDNIYASTGAVPEASTWAMMLVGFGAVGGVMRSRRRTTRTLAAA